MFFGVILVASVVMFAGTSSVQAASGNSGLATGLGYIAAALVTGISGLGSGIAVASSASAALGALSEDGSLFGKSIYLRSYGRRYRPLRTDHFLYDPW